MRVKLQAKRGDPNWPEATVDIHISMNAANDAPPALVEAIGRSFAAIAHAIGDLGAMEEIAQQCEEIRARRQRYADQAARMLLGDEEPEL